MTHDLLMDVIETVGCRIDKIVMDNIEETTYYATIFLRDQNGKALEFDARPSDSIAIALRASAPIYVTENVFEASVADERAHRFREEYYKNGL
ncbi:bifunctional nuclease family protein [Candidatus Acetothermia bacterium]|nr:bifunctional nuclease family protein [Candidatus Acetothermia bacterium]MBI3644241.1 bifunctional nuclease family protein [Candidatus Acetothermia bacterium]